MPVLYEAWPAARTSGSLDDSTPLSVSFRVGASALVLRPTPSRVRSGTLSRRWQDQHRRTAARQTQQARYILIVHHGAAPLRLLHTPASASRPGTPLQPATLYIFCTLYDSLYCLPKCSFVRPCRDLALRHSAVAQRAPVRRAQEKSTPSLSPSALRHRHTPIAAVTNAPICGAKSFNGGMFVFRPDLKVACDYRLITL
eukprot:5642833-Prymnesium_polylepis.1